MSSMHLGRSCVSGSSDLPEPAAITTARASETPRGRNPRSISFNSSTPPGRENSPRVTLWAARGGAPARQDLTLDLLEPLDADVAVDLLERHDVVVEGRQPAPSAACRGPSR